MGQYKIIILSENLVNNHHLQYDYFILQDCFVRENYCVMYKLGIF